MKLDKPARTARQARRLRRELSLPEVLLWTALRTRPNSLKFRRQHPAGPFILDFYCARARLCVEIDGAAHGLGDRPARDQRRDALLAEHGIATLRIAADALLHDLSTVLSQILAEAAARQPLHHPAEPGGPPPRERLGEDEGAIILITS